MSRLFATLLMFCICLLNSHKCRADIIFDLVNLPSEQDSAQLSATITTVDLTDGAFIQEADILSWQFTVDKPAVGSYSVASTDSESFLDIDSTFSLRFSSGELQLFGQLQMGNTIGGIFPTTVFWRETGSEFYFSNFQGNVSPRGWQTLNPSGFAVPNGLTSGWVIGHAIPEPSSALTLAPVVVSFLMRRRRAKQLHP